MADTDLDRTLELARRLIAFPTVSRESNLDLIDFAERHFKRLGATTRRFANAEGTKANLLATLAPESSSREGGILLSGHSDVVPVEGQDWSHDPFEASVHDGRLYGRGSTDMKTFLALVMRFAETLDPDCLTEPVHFAFSYDEEVGCTGVRSLVRELAGWKVRPRACLIGEPTSLQVVTAHKGIRAYETRIRGKSTHSSMPHKGLSAVDIACEMIGWLKGAIRDYGEGHRDAAFDPPWPTLNIGTLSAGTAINIIPQDAVFTWEYRPLPGTGEEDIIRRFRDYTHKREAELKKQADGAKIETRVLAEAPGLAAQADNPAEELAKFLVRSNETGTVSYATEAGHFQATAGIPAVVCGPGSIEQAHRPDEYIELSQIREALTLFARLREKLYGPA